MEVMISINPPYTDMIFSGCKPFEFRKQVLKEMDQGYILDDVTAYIYETKNKGGVGAVIGEVPILGAYTLNYGKGDGTDSYVTERNECVKCLYFHWCGLKGIKPNKNEGWFKSKRFREYLEKIGFYPNLDFNYALVLGDPKKYEKAVPLHAFKSIKGESLTRPPQNMFRVSCGNFAADGEREVVP